MSHNSYKQNAIKYCNCLFLVTGVKKGDDKFEPKKRRSEKNS